MQSLAGAAEPRSKRRKINHPDETTLTDEVHDSQDETKDIDNIAEDEETDDLFPNDGLPDGDEEDNPDSADPFQVHFADPDDNALTKKLKSLQSRNWTTSKVSLGKIGTASIAVPQVDGIDEPPFSELVLEAGALKLKQKLANTIKVQNITFEPLEQTLAGHIFGYQDTFVCGRSPENSESLRRLTCLHAINHVFKTRDRVIKNNTKLASESEDNGLELRDQGFTRPKILMLLPTRESCVRMVNMITSLCQPEQQENKKRFDDSYIDKEEKFSLDKTEDFRELFGGNDDDMFRIGMKFTRKTVKYFSQFYNSDIIFASPLGLRMAIGTDEDKKVDYDFLSSIEIVIVDQADALLMQNWEHVEYIFEHLNLQPKEAHGCDFGRVRSWYLDNNARYFRQTIALAGFNTPELNTLFYNQSMNWAGKTKITPNYPGLIQDLGIKTRQTFSRLECPTFSTDPESRFTYFTSTIIPSLTKRSKDSVGTLIFIPSYLDFVRLRNYFSSSASTSVLSFGSISEYTTVRDVARARSHFLTGRHSVLLYTERAHHFRRYQLKGVKRIIMYGLPDNPVFYKEIAGGYLARSVQEGLLNHGEGSVRAIFSRWDVLKLERVVGTDRLRKMIADKGDTFDFL